MAAPAAPSPGRGRGVVRLAARDRGALAGGAFADSAVAGVDGLLLVAPLVNMAILSRTLRSLRSSFRQIGAALTPSADPTPDGDRELFLRTSPNGRARPGRELSESAQEKPVTATELAPTPWREFERWHFLCQVLYTDLIFQYYEN